MKGEIQKKGIGSLFTNKLHRLFRSQVRDMTTILKPWNDFMIPVPGRIIRSVIFGMLTVVIHAHCTSE